MPTSTSRLPAVVARAGDCERLVFPDGSTMTLLADSPATGGKLSVHHTTLHDGADGAGPHHHGEVAEVIYVLAGTVQVLVGDEVIEVTDGDLAVVPPGMTHAFAAAPGSDAELLVAATPGVERFDFFRCFEAVVAGREPRTSFPADQSAYDTYPDASGIWEENRPSTTPSTTASTTPSTRPAIPADPEPQEHPMTDVPTVFSADSDGVTEHRTMNTVIHAAFRRDLRRLDGAFARFPAGSRTRADQLAAAWDNVSHQLHLHHHDEETLFWPAFVELGADQSLMAALEGEHVAMVTALTAAEAAMEGFVAEPTAGNAAAARRAVAELSQVLDDHLTHEERDLEPFGAAHADSPQHKAAVARARKSHTEGAGNFFAWLGDTDDPDIAPALRREVPAPVLFLLTKLGGRRYRRISTAAWI